MTRHVEFWHDADSAHPGVFDDLAHLRLCVVIPVRTKLVKLRKLFTLDSEALVFGDVQMQDVELDRGHSVQVALDYLHRLPMPPDVNQQPAPRETRPVLNAHRRDEVTLCGAS